MLDILKTAQGSIIRGLILLVIAMPLAMWLGVKIGQFVAG